jgi:hypothetical protein
MKSVSIVVYSLRYISACEDQIVTLPCRLCVDVFELKGAQENWKLISGFGFAYVFCVLEFIW